jgi:hypothetical protein
MPGLPLDVRHITLSTGPTIRARLWQKSLSFVVPPN